MGNEIYNYPGFANITVNAVKTGRSHDRRRDADKVRSVYGIRICEPFERGTPCGAGQGEIGDGRDVLCRVHLNARQVIPSALCAVTAVNTCRRHDAD